MKIEDRLHEALHEYADGIEPAPGSWARIAARFDGAPAPRRPSRRPLVFAGAAIVLVVVLVAGVLVRDAGDDTKVVTKPGGVTDSTLQQSTVALPTGVLTVVGSQHFVVLGAVDGRQHSSFGTLRGPRSPSTTPDGREVFFQSTGTGVACGGNPAPEVNKLVPADETTTPVVNGSNSPQVSPDGKWLASGTWCDHRTLAFRNIATGGISRTNPLGDLGHEAAPNVDTVEPLGWSPDSTQLLYRLGLKGDQDPHYYVGRVWPVVVQAQTKVTALPYGREITAAAFIDDENVALAETTTSGGTEVRSWKVDTGSTELPSPVLFEVAGRVTSLAADPSGQHILAVTQTGDLYRWSQGDARPTKLAAGVTAAVWIPWS